MKTVISMVAVSFLSAALVGSVYADASNKVANPGQ